jgi:hypothetical protein
MNTVRESNLTRAYREAYRIAREKIVGSNPQEVSRNSKALFDQVTDSFILRYFDLEYRVCRKDGAVVYRNAPGDPPVTEKVLIIHYLIFAGPQPLSGESVSFREIPGGGSIYYSNFQKRAIDPLVKAFGNQPAAFATAAGALGGVPEKYGTVSSTLLAFPLVPVTYVLWRGDAELPASGSILFDASVAGFLPVEDIVLAGSAGVYKLIGQSRPEHTGGKD